LTVPRLGRVNLIVGRNNVGKTMFLEALRLYSLGGSWRALRSLLMERDEFLTDEPGAGEESTDVPLRIESLFHRLPGDLRRDPVFEIGPVGEPENRLRVEIRWLRKVRTAEAKRTYRLELIPRGTSEPEAGYDVVPGLTSAFKGIDDLIMIYQLGAGPRAAYRSEEVLETAFIPARGASERDVARWWDAISLRDAEARVYDCLRLVAPVERVSYVEAPGRIRERVAMVRLAGERAPVPLKSMGDGLGRMFQIAVAIEKTRLHRQAEEALVPPLFPSSEPNGRPPAPVLLIDEVENGIHYSVHPKLWHFIISTAKLHNVQVFATTHSWDCILGLREAVALNADADAQLIRLEKRDGVDKAVIFDQGELPIIARDEIEVR
jgi:hypothetical protein